jgi:hypothetical protein
MQEEDATDLNDEKDLARNDTNFVAKSFFENYFRSDNGENH